MPQVVANSHQFDVELLRASRAPLANAAAPQVAALSNFGFAGTNVHILVEEQPAAAVGSAVTACRLFADDATGEERLRLGCLARTTAVVWERKAYPLSTATAARPLSAAAQLVREWERARPPPAAEMGEAQVLDAVRLVALGGVPAHARLEGDALRAPLASLGCSHAAELQILSTVNARFGTSLTLKAVDVGGGGGAGGAGGAGDSGGVPTASVASIAAEVSEHLRYARAQKSVRSEAEVRRAVQVIVLDNLPAGAELSDADCEGRTLMQLGASSMSIMQACQCQAMPCHAMPCHAAFSGGPVLLWLAPPKSVTHAPAPHAAGTDDVPRQQPVWHRADDADGHRQRAVDGPQHRYAHRRPPGASHPAARQTGQARQAGRRQRRSPHGEQVSPHGFACRTTHCWQLL